jgi:hypothetical protein
MYLRAYDVPALAIMTFLATQLIREILLVWAPPPKAHPAEYGRREEQAKNVFADTERPF